MKNRNSNYIDVYRDNLTCPSVIYVILRQHWGFAHVHDALKQVETLIADLPHKVMVFVDLKNDSWLPPNSVEALAELATELHPALEHIVFVGSGPLIETAFTGIEDQYAGSANYVHEDEIVAAIYNYIDEHSWDRIDTIGLISA